jgi:F-type H+-transporting ATPase subunit delta
MTAEHDVKGTVFEDDISGVSRNYAEALLNIVQQDGSADAALDELDQIVSDVLVAHPQFTAILMSPSVPAHEKTRILAQTFDGRAMPVVARFLRVLNDRGRLSLIRAVAREARALWNQRQNKVPVTVRSATGLDERQQAALKEKLSRLTGGTPVVTFQTDSALIGGLFVQVGDHVYDASLRNQLEQMRRRLIDSKTQDLRHRKLVEV